MDPDIRKLAMRIESKMRVAYRSLRVRVFWPEQFTEDGNLTDISRALKSLAESGKIVLVTTALCENGHIIWSGSPDSIDSLVEQCHECDDPLDIEVHFHLRAELTDEWVEEIDGERFLDKKKASGWM